MTMMKIILFFFQDMVEKDETLIYQDMEYNDEDMFKKLL